MYFVLFGTDTSGTVDCTFVRTDAWLDFSQDLVSLWPKTRQRSEQMRRLFTFHHGSHSQLLKEQMPTTQINVPTEVSQKFFRQQERRSPKAPHTHAIPTGSIASVLVSSVSSLPKQKVMAFASWIRCVFRPPSSCGHPFPLLKSTLSNQET